MSLRVFLPLVLLLAVGGFGAGFLLGARTTVDAIPEASPGGAADTPTQRAAEGDLRRAADAGDMQRLRLISEQARGTSLGARALLAVVRAQPPTVRAAAQQSFLRRYPTSWLRLAWSAEAPGRGAR